MHTYNEIDRDNIAYFSFIADSGHGWLCVTEDEIAELGIANRISEFSYVSPDGVVFLEEDCDADTFLDAYKTKHQTEVKLNLRQVDRWDGRDRFQRWPGCLRSIYDRVAV